MDDLPILFAACVLLTSVLASIAVWAPRRVSLKVGALGATALTAVLAYASLTALLSRPKPVTLEWAQREATEATVLAAQIEEGEAIFLWLRLPGDAEPRAYRLPWNPAAARDLHRALRHRERTGSDIVMAKPFADHQYESEFVFYPAPQPAQPAKAVSQNSPVVVPGTSRPDG